MITDKWPRDKALQIRTLIDKLNLCCCGTDAEWVCILELLAEAEIHSDQGFYRDKWFEFGAKVLDRFGLLEHGGSVGYSWLTEDGKLLLEFLRDFGTEGHDFSESTSHPLWSVEFSWDETENKADTYSEWVREKGTLNAD